MARVPAIPDNDGLAHNNDWYTLKATADFKLGAFVKLTSGELEECGADPALILGAALVACGTAAGLAAGKSLDPQDSTKVIVAKAGENNYFWMQCSSDPVVATHKGNSYGVAKDADGIWYVDFTDTSNTRVYVHTVDVDKKAVKVSVLAANRQAAP